MKEQIATWKKMMDDKKAKYGEIMDYHHKCSSYHNKQIEDPLVFDKEIHKEIADVLRRHYYQLNETLNNELILLRKHIHDYEFKLECRIDKVCWRR